MPIRLACLPVVYGLLVAMPQDAVLAQASEEESPGEIAREGVEHLMRALDAFIDMIPQYETPELNENGDIIIRRKPRRNSQPNEEPEIDETRT